MITDLQANTLYSIEAILNDNDFGMSNNIINIYEILEYVNRCIVLCGMENIFVVNHEEDTDSNVIPGLVSIIGDFDEETYKCHLTIKSLDIDMPYGYFWNDIQWKNIRGSIFDTIAHELIHLYTALNRSGFTKRTLLNGKEISSFAKFTIKNSSYYETALYLAQPEEIEAFAFNIACQLFRRFNDVDTCISYMKSSLKYQRIENLNEYTFYFNADSYVLKRLYKRIILHLENKYMYNYDTNKK